MQKRIESQPLLNSMRWMPVADGVVGSSLQKLRFFTSALPECRSSITQSH